MNRDGTDRPGGRGLIGGKAGGLAVAFAVATLVIVAWSGWAAAWDYSSSCADSKTRSFQKIQPQINLMLDRSGSMSYSTSVTKCQECNYEVYNGSTVQTNTVNWSTYGATVSTTFSGYTPSSCMGLRFDLYGDYDYSTEYANLYADGSYLGRLCNGGCSQCGGPFRGAWTTTSAASDSSIQATVSNSSDVHSFCSANRADISLLDYQTGSTFTGSFDCPDCATDQDCVARSGHPGCAVKSATLGTYSCSSSLSKWRVASRSIRTVVSDLTTPDPDTAEFGLGMFTTGAWNEVMPKENAYGDIKNALSSESPYGGTDLKDAVNQTASTLSSAGTSSRVQASVLITDGKHSYDDTDVINAACQHHSAGDDLYVVGFGDGTDVEFNHAVAAAGGSGTCCDPGTGPCSKGDSNYVDICSLSDSTLENSYNDGRQLDCSGAIQTDTGTGLKNAITSIANDLSCTFDVSGFGGKWKDSYYDCAPHYDCFKVYIPGTGERLYHHNSSNSPKGWQWVDSAKQEQIILDNYYCSKVKSLSNNDVEVTRACMCDEPKKERCYSNTSSKRDCTCRADRWYCSQGVDVCQSYQLSNCPSALVGEGQSCTYGLGVCTKTGTTKCDSSGNLICGTNESTYTAGQAFHLNAVSDDKWVYVPLKQKNYNRTPLVFATTFTDKGGQDPSQAHIRNVTKSGGDTQHCEVDLGSSGPYCDAHDPEQNGWFAFDPDKLRNLRGIDAGYYESTAGSHVHDGIRFGFRFRRVPLVFTQVQTQNGPDPPRNTQVISRTRNGATVEFCEQNSNTGCGYHRREKVGWLAVDPGLAEFHGFDAGEIWAAGGGTWYTVNFSQSFQTKPFVVVNTQTERDGEEALYAEVRNVTKSSAEIRFCEYDGNDGCHSHAYERLAWMAFTRNDVTSKGYGDKQEALTPPEDPEVSCDGLDNDCDGKTDENLGPRRCNTGKSGRCSVGSQDCKNGGWTTCKPVKRAVPEICNGLDDDCNGVVDDISESWRKSWSSISTANFSSEEEGRICGKSGSCSCPSASARDDTYRGDGSGTLQSEFDDLVDETVQNDTTDCTCSE